MPLPLLHSMAHPQNMLVPYGVMLIAAIKNFHVTVWYERPSQQLFKRENERVAASHAPKRLTQDRAETGLCYPPLILRSPAAFDVPTSNSANLPGSRRMVQMEVAAPFPPLFGFNATSTACPAITLSRGSTTNSFSSANGGTYATTVQQTGGTLGANGGVNLSGGGTQVGGSITAGDGLTGSCPHGLNASGGSGMVAGQTGANTLLPATQGINVADQ